METRLYSYTNATPEEVEMQIRRYVPEGPRVLVQPDLQQVMVIADRQTHGQVATLLSRIDQPVAHLVIWYRHNREARKLDLIDGATGTLPVTRTPPKELVEMARSHLPPEQQRLPVVGSALHIHAVLLRQDPAMVRLRVTPAVTFGITPPYEPVIFEDLATDQMINTLEFVDLVDTLRQNEFYANFFQSQPDPDHPPRPVGLLITLDHIYFDTDTPDEEP